MQYIGLSNLECNNQIRDSLHFILIWNSSNHDNFQSVQKLPSRIELRHLLKLLKINHRLILPQGLLELSQPRWVWNSWRQLQRSLVAFSSEPEGPRILELSHLSCLRRRPRSLLKLQGSCLKPAEALSLQHCRICAPWGWCRGHLLRVCQSRSGR